MPNKAVAPNLGFGGSTGQDVVLRSGMCTPFSGGPQRDSRMGEAGMVLDSGFAVDAVLNPPITPLQALHPVLTGSGRGDSGGVPVVLSNEPRRACGVV